jgi:hypothetical protein
VNSLPQELIDRVIDLACLPAATEEDILIAARACALINPAWSRRSRQILFSTITLNPVLLARWDKNIPDSAQEPASFVRVVYLESPAAEYLIEHIDRLKAFNQVAVLSLSLFDGETFDGEKIERCFAHFGRTVKFLELLKPKCETSLFAHLLNLFAGAARVDILTPHITQDTAKAEYRPLPKLELLRLGLEGDAVFDYGMLEACINLKGVYILCPRSAAKFWMNRLFIRCADTLESILIGAEYPGELKSPPSTRTRRVFSLTCFADRYPVEDASPDHVPLSAHCSIAPCTNICEINMAVAPSGPGTLAQEIITSAQTAKLHRVFLMFDCKIEADFESQINFEAWEAFEGRLCYVADRKLKRDPPETFVVTLLFTPYAKKYIKEAGGELRLGKFLDGLRGRGVLKVHTKW